MLHKFFFTVCGIFWSYYFFFFNLSIFGNPLEILNSVLFTGFQNNNNELKIYLVEITKILYVCMSLQKV